MNNTYDYTRIHSLHSQQAQQNQRNTSKGLHPVSAAAMKNQNEKGPKITVSGPSPLLIISSGTEFVKWFSHHKEIHSIFPEELFTESWTLCARGRTKYIG
jgi:hypothetical protein